MELSISFYAGKIFCHDTIRIRFSIILMELIYIFDLKISCFFGGEGHIPYNRDQDKSFAVSLLILNVLIWMEQ